MSRAASSVELPWLRPIPGDTVVHRLWAGTKLVAVIAFGAALSINPSWPAIGVVTLPVTVALLAARIPLGARPRLPAWFWLVLLVGALIGLRSGGPPIVHVGAVGFELGGVNTWARVTAIPVLLLAAAALLTWTTPLAELAPALAVLFSPLRLLRLPVDEWATTLALSLRCLPLLVDETRTLLAARRLRPARPGRTWRHRIGEPHDLLTAALVTALRRAEELGQAVEARGGIGAVADRPARPAWRDAVTIVLIAAVTAAAIAV